MQTKEEHFVVVERRSRSVVVAFVSTALLFVGVGDSKLTAALMHAPLVTPESQYLNHADLFPSVGWMSTVIGGNEESFSSAVLISPNWAITSGHGVLEVDSDPTSFRDTYEVGFGNNFITDPGESQFADEVFLNPRYRGVEDGPDIALLYFRNPFTSISPVEIYEGPNPTGAVYDMVGFGTPGTPATGLQEHDYERRAGQGEIRDSIHFGYLQSLFRQPGHPDFLPLGIQGTPGDSGGGWFVNGELVAITSDAGSPRYGGDTTAFVLGNEIQWINQTQASVTLPEPASGLLVVVGLTTILAARKQRCA